MAPEAFTLHRSQLLYNRARLLSGLGRKDEAYQIFTVLSELDPQRCAALLAHLPAGQVVLTTAGVLPDAAHPDAILRIDAGAVVA